MPKSKVRKSARKKSKGSASTRPLSSHPSTSRPNQYIVKAGVLKAGPHVLSLPDPLIIRGQVKPQLSSAWEKSGKGIEVALGASEAFLRTLSEEAQATLAASSANGKMATAYEEMFAWGFLRPEALDSDAVREWLNDTYLGTWEDPTYAIGSFLRDIAKTPDVEPLKRRIAYERLAQMAEISEQPLGNGRTIVFLDRDFDDERRFLANQYMIHGSMPEIIGFG